MTSHGLALRVIKLREGEPPEVLGAAEQFAKVRELLATQDPAAWPAYGGLLEVRGFADEVRQLLTRMQESLLSPKELAEAADRARAHRLERAGPLRAGVPRRPGDGQPS